jgi:hypothetical protein
VPLTPITIRFDAQVLEFIGGEAAAAGESVAEFIRVAALARAAVFYARRDGPGAGTFEELVGVARAWDQRYRESK